ncbi:MAG: hypothetical protein HKM88_05945 [Halobacteria archaeon]|nr:hypothetical protein [Halobacteria archaeon]
MSTRCNKLVLLVIAFTLAVTPLRGTFALQIDTADSKADESHCAQMQADIGHPPEHQQARYDQGTEDPAGHDCEQGCGGACCDGTCNACAHGVPTAMTGALPFQPGFADAVLNSRHSHVFPERSLPPPLHPPAALLS